MRTSVRRPLGKNADTMRFKEIQRDLAKARMGRGVNVFYREGPGGTAVYVEPTAPPPQTTGGEAVWL